MKQIILASASPRRRELLTQAGIVFTVKVSDAEEIITENAPDKVVKELALLKAKAVAETEEDALVIGADTIVAAEGNILGKPHSREEAFSMLSMLQGKTHQVYTGVALITKEAGKEKQEVFAEKTDVTFYPMTEKEIWGYIDTGEPMDKAGSYGIQGRAAVYIEKISGDYNNVVGLPVAKLYQALKKY
ncbi:Maf family protein [Lachnospiraceae bacterium 46-15]